MAKYRSQSRPVFGQKSADFVLQDHRSRCIAQIVDQLDLSSFDKAFKNDGVGRSAFPVRRLIALLVYSFLEGVYSTRRIERYCHENVIYRYLCNDDPPDHSTISRFWKRFGLEIESLFQQVLKMAEKLSLVHYQHVAGDGVRISSMGSRSMLFSHQNAVKTLDKMKARELKNEKINLHLKEKLEKAVPNLEKLKIKGTEPKIEHSTFAHLTEPDARLIKKKDRYISGYNAQAIVDQGNSIVLEAGLVRNSFDRYNGKPILNQMLNKLGIDKIRKADITFDNGYEDEDFFAFASEHQLKLYVPTNDPNDSNLKKRKIKQDKFTPNYEEKKDSYICFDKQIIPFKRVNFLNGLAYGVYERSCAKCQYVNDCIKEKRKRKRVNRPMPWCNNLDEIQKARNSNMRYRIEMFNKMSTEEAREVYSHRIATVEPVFAQIQSNRGFRRFTVWGLEKVYPQWIFICMIHNLFKIAVSQGMVT